MRNSFEPLHGLVLPDDAGELSEQSVDLVAGLALRRPRSNRSGVYVDARGQVLTNGAGLEACTSVTIGDGVTSQVTPLPGDLDLVILSPDTPQAPKDWASFKDAPGRLSSEIAIAGFA